MASSPGGVASVVTPEGAARESAALGTVPPIVAPTSVRATPEASTPAASSAPPSFDRAAFRRLFVVVMLPMFLAAIDQTLLATATPVISRELGGLRDASWLAVGYLLASVVMVPVYGRLGDRFGRRRVLGIAIVVFAVGSFACGFAPTLGALIAGRVVQGIGGGGLMTLSQALIGELVSPRLRAKNQSYFAAIFTLASVGGPVIGGLVVHHASWRWLFWVNLPICAVAAWRLRRMRSDDRTHPASGKPDAIGVVLFAIATSTSLLWLSSAGHRFAWLSATSALLLAIAVAVVVGLIFVERRAARPFLPTELLALRAVRFAVLTVMAFASAMFALVFYLPVYLQLALRTNAAEAGLLLLPLTVGIALGAVVTGRVIVRTGRPTVMPIIGLSIAATSLVALAFAPPSRNVLIGLELTTGMGFGGVMSVMQIVTQQAAGPARLGAAASTISLARTFGSSIGASAFGALIYGVIGGSPTFGGTRDAAAIAGIDRAFHFAFFAAALLCVAGAWCASRVPTLRFDRDDVPPAAVE